MIQKQFGEYGEISKYVILNNMDLFTLACSKLPIFKDVYDEYQAITIVLLWHGFLVLFALYILSNIQGPIF